MRIIEHVNQQTSFTSYHSTWKKYEISFEKRKSFLLLYQRLYILVHCSRSVTSCILMTVHLTLPSEKIMFIFLLILCLMALRTLVKVFKFMCYIDVALGIRSEVWDWFVNHDYQIMNDKWCLPSVTKMIYDKFCSMYTKDCNPKPLHSILQLCQFYWILWQYVRPENRLQM